MGLVLETGKSDTQILPAAAHPDQDRVLSQEAVALSIGRPVLRFLEVTRRVPDPRPEDNSLRTPWHGISSFLLDIYWQSLPSNRERQTQGMEKLTDRERETATLYAETGLSQTVISVILDISPAAASKAIQRAYGRLGVHSQTELSQVMDKAFPADLGQDDSLAAVNELTWAQAEIFGYIQRGFSNDMIAKILGLKSRRSVESAVDRTYPKLGVTNRFEAVRLGTLAKRQAEERIVAMIKSPNQIPTIAEVKASRLSSPEELVFFLIAGGYSPSQIADERGISRHTVYTNTWSAKTKLEAVDNQEALAVLDAAKAPADYDDTASDDLELIASLPLFQLRRSEVRILSLMAQGKSDQEIQLELGRKQRTIDKTRRNILRLLGAKSNEAALEKVSVDARTVSLAAFYQVCAKAKQRQSRYKHPPDTSSTSVDPEDIDLFTVAPEGAAAESLESLTDHQREVCILAARGMTNQEIGDKLGLEPTTIGDHLFKAYAKLNISSRKDLRNFFEFGEDFIDGLCFDGLSAKARRAIDLASIGWQDWQIAAALGVEPSTARGHLLKAVKNFLPLAIHDVSFARSAYITKNWKGRRELCSPLSLEGCVWSNRKPVPDVCK